MRVVSSEPLRIYFNAGALLSPRTGIGQYCLNLMSEVEKISNVEAHFFYAGIWSDKLLKHPPVNSEVTKKIKVAIGKIFPNLAYEIQHRRRGKSFKLGIEKHGFGLYHEPNFLLFKTKLPSVVTVHDLSILRYPETHPKDRVAFMSKRIGKSILLADRVITDSEYVRQEIIEEFNLSPDKVVSVLLAAADNFSPVSGDELVTGLKQFGLCAGRYILAVGTLEPRKNLTTAIKAYACLPEAIREEFPFVIVGMTGWRTEGLDHEISSLISKGQIRRLGYVPDDILPTLYSGARVFVYPSLYEGFGLPPLEAMACGVPVIVSNRSSLPEVVGEVGVKVDALDYENLADSMLSIIENDELCTSLGQQGIERAKRFSWKRCAEETIDVYRQIVTP